MDAIRQRISRWTGRLRMQDFLFLCLQFIIAVVILVFLRFLPPPGWAVAVMAAAAVFISLQGDMRGWQKAFWMVLICALLLVELRSISADRTQSDKRASDDRQMQYEEFQKIENGQSADRKATAIGLGSIESTQERLMSVIPPTDGKGTRHRKVVRSDHR